MKCNMQLKCQTTSWMYASTRSDLIHHKKKMPTTQTSLSMPLLCEPPSELSVFHYTKSATNYDRYRKCRESYSWAYLRFLRNFGSTPFIEGCFWVFGFLIPFRWAFLFWLWLVWFFDLLSKSVGMVFSFSATSMRKLHIRATWTHTPSLFIEVLLEQSDILTCHSLDYTMENYFAQSHGLSSNTLLVLVGFRSW